jgi:hypothetical protein
MCHALILVSRICLLQIHFCLLALLMISDSLNHVFFFWKKTQLPLVKTLSAQTSSMPHTADLRKAILVPRAPGASWKNSLMVAARDHNGREPYMFLNKGDIVLCACEPQPVTGQACRAVLAHRVTVHDDGSYTVHNAQHLVLTSTFTPDTPSASSSSCAP